MYTSTQKPSADAMIMMRRSRTNGHRAGHDTAAAAAARRLKRNTKQSGPQEPSRYDEADQKSLSEYIQVIHRSLTLLGTRCPTKRASFIDQAAVEGHLR